MTIMNQSLNTAASGSSPQAGNPVSGNTQLELMEVLGQAFKIGQKDQDAQPDPMIAYVEEAYANATAHLSFEARQAYWKNLANHMQGLPKQIQAFFTAQNNLFNNNPALEKLQKELQDVQNQYNSDKNSEKTAELTAKIAFATAGALAVAAALAFLIPVVGPLIAAGLLIASAAAAAVGVAAEIAAGVYSAKEGADQNQINTDTEEMGSLEGGIEAQSQVLAAKMNNEAETAISNDKMTSEALVGVLKTETSVANQLSKANVA